MDKAIPYFTFTNNQMVFTFQDVSTGVVDSRLWDFGFEVLGVPQTSTSASPIITFPTSGQYNVSLAVTNAGGTAIFTMIIIASTTPALNITIMQMVLQDLPPNIPVNTNGFYQQIKKWQLYLQPSFDISDADVFDETKWPPLANVLVSKLIIYDLIILAAQNSMTSLSVNNSGQSTAGFETVLLSDYSMNFPITEPINIISTLINGNVLLGPTDPITNSTELLAFFNSLNAGVFTYTNPTLFALANRNLITSLIYATVANPGVESSVNFAQDNQRIVTIASTTTSNVVSSFGSVGAVKSIQTGPSKAEWHDSSAFWKNMFSNSSSSSSATGMPGGVFSQIQQEVCMFARRLGVRIFFCPKPLSTKVFIVSKKRKNC